MDICKIHRATKEAVCLTCFERICFACVFILHSAHRTIALNELDNEIQKVVNDLQIEVTSLENELEILHAQIKTQENMSRAKCEDELDTITTCAKEQFQCQLNQFESLRQEVLFADDSSTKMYKKLFLEVQTSVHYFSEAVNRILHESRVSYLQFLNELKTQIESEETKLSDLKNYFQNNASKYLTRPASLSAKSAVFVKGRALGVIKVTPTQAIIIRNYQDSKNYIHIACVSCAKPNILNWEKTFEIDQNPPLISIANSVMIRLQGVTILVAFGKKVLTIEIHINVDICLAFFKSSTVIDLNIPNNAHITGVAGVLGELGHEEVVTTDNSSGLFHIFDVNFNLSERVKCPEKCQILACLQKDDIYKLVVSVNSLSASVLRGKAKLQELRCVGKIENTFKDRKMFVKSAVFDGTLFSVLWVSQGEFTGDIMQWRVIAYDSDGVQFRVSSEGQCETEIKPVLISHIKNKTLVSFSDGSFKEFSTGGLEDFEFLSTKEPSRVLEENQGAILKGLANMLKAALE